MLVSATSGQGVDDLGAWLARLPQRSGAAV
jgi:hypothetical protein